MLAAVVGVAGVLLCVANPSRAWAWAPTPGWTRGRVLALAALGVAGLLCSAPGAAGATTVELRVEAAGAPAPLFAGPVTTEPHPVDGGDGSGVHACAGPAGAPPSATATGALADAMRAAGIAWRGNWDPSFRDFFIERIGAYSSRAPDEYWSLTVDGRYASGGCQAALAEGDEVRFYYGPLFGEQSGVEGGGGGGAGTPVAPGGGGSTTVPGPAAAVPAPPVHPGHLASRAAHYLRRHQEAAGELWSRLALAVRGAGGGDPVGTAATSLLDRGPGTAATEPPGADPTSRDPRIGVALTAPILGELRRDGSLRGDVDATALAVIALGRVAPRSAARAAGWIVRVQGPTGGFGFRPGVPPDVDSTGLAAWALARAGRAAAARRAALFVASAQAADGGFPAPPGGESNAQSTGLGLVALRVGGVGADHPAASGATALTYLTGLGRPDGSIPYAAGSDPTPVWSTAQALLGLLPRSKLLRP